jgi:methyl-accepting chemotaxis protein
MLANIKIRTLVIAVLATLMAAVFAVGSLGLYGAMHTRDVFRDVALRDRQAENTFVQIRLLMETNRSQVLQALQHNPGFDWAKLHDHPLDVHWTTIAKASQEIDQLWRQYYAAITSADEKKLADAWYEKSRGLGVALVGEAAEDIKGGRWDEAEHVLITAINPGYRVGTVASGELSAFLAAHSRAHDAEVERGIAAIRWLLIGAMAGTLLLGLGAMKALVSGITRPLQQAIGIARRVAAGDLGSRIEVRSRNELGELLGSLKHMNENLVAIVGSVRDGSDSIAIGAGQIATGNADLSNRTEQQAGSLQQTASSMEQLTAAVRANAEAAAAAEKLAKSASEVAVRGGATVAEVVSTMEAISASSKKIGDIIGVIDGIAFQTNILALNAAVEAARAGEQGRGFAVVATEVRNLAHRSAAAAKEIKELIGDSVGKVEAGTRLVDAAGTTMGEIVGAVRRVADLMAEIDAASAEQSQGIGQVNQSIAEMDDATQQNAALVEEAAAAADALREQSDRLAQAVSAFRLDEPGGAGTPAPAAARPLPAARPAPVAQRKALAATEDWEQF